jgi:hypothetical protein
MAVFTDQFDRHAVLISRNSGSNQQLLSIKSEIETFIGSMDLTRLSMIARQVDHAIQGVVASRGSEVAIPDPDFVPREIIGTESADIQREIIGDFQLLVALDGIHAWSNEPVQSARWERFAALSMWKLIDAMWVVVFDPDLPKAANRQCAEFLVFDDRVLRYALEAMRALQVAQSIKLEERIVSERNRINGVLANPNAEANRLRALEMAEEIPFRSMNKAAGHIADNLVKGTTKAGKETFYSTDWIKAWLRDAAWTPRHKRKPPQ